MTSPAISLSRRLFLGRFGATAAGSLAASAAGLQAPAYKSQKAYDDGPLLADDVTGTNAFELYAAGDPDWRVNARSTRTVRS